MINPTSGYAPKVTPNPSLRDNAVQPARSVSVPSPAGISTFTTDVGLAPRAGAAGSGAAAGAAAAAGPSRPNVALLEAMQASRQTSSLLSSLLTPAGSFFQPPTPAAVVPPGQSALQRPSLALLESMQTGRTSSALLSSIMGRGETTPAATISQPWTPNSQAGRAAYMMQGGPTQSNAGQWPQSVNTTREWFA